jgi:PIN domain nuclease of toxin-antitoxin system
MKAVLDASAVIALLQGEPGAELVASIARFSLLGAVNFAEVLMVAIEQGGDLERAGAEIRRFEIQIVEFDASLAEMAARLRPETRALGRSLADRACLALARSRGLPVYSSDRKWAELDLGIDIRMIR